MVKKHNIKTEESSLVHKIALGIIAAIAMMLFSAGVFAIMISKEIISEAGTGYCSVTVLLLSSFSASLVAISNYKKMRIWTSVITGVTYSAVLLGMTAVFFDGEYRGILVTVMVVLSGCMIATILSRKGNNTLRLQRNKNRRW